ncbi:MAG: class I SAM-dependent methyltransferase [Actinomycetota bacterium]|nr:class I SAM-dependent methyltransferase [Actinomycetota bacterium]
MTVHETAAAGYRVAGADYERARPDYPQEVLGILVEELGVGRTTTAVELGAGTGKFTRMLVQEVGLLVATEPVAAMRGELAAAVATPVVAAAAEAVPLGAASVDLVVAATAFHWFRGREALAEAHRVLRPGGGLALVWNNPDRRCDWVARIWGMVDEHRGDTPGNRDQRWREAFTGDTGFTPLTSRHLSHRARMSVDDLVTRVGSISFIASLEPDEKESFLATVRAVVAGQDEVELPYVTEVHWCRRR